ncbi:MAG: rhodanese-like domain-containing protein [Flavobacteriales bacterium]
MKHTLIIAMSFVLALFSCSDTKSQDSKSDLTAQEFAAQIKNSPNGIVLDVRTPGEFSGGHLANALNIDWNGNNFDTEVKKLDKNKPLFVYCKGGGRSASAADRLRALGFTKVYELAGGILAWEAAKMPVEK